MKKSSRIFFYIFFFIQRWIFVVGDIGFEIFSFSTAASGGRILLLIFFFATAARWGGLCAVQFTDFLAKHFNFSSLYFSERTKFFI
jgi:hypothetical protein